MYGLWYIVIGLLVGLILDIVVSIVLVKKFDIDTDGTLFDMFRIVVGAILSFLIIMVGAFAILMPIAAKQEYLEFEETRTMIEQIYESGEVEDNYAINIAVINSNQWLSKVKASKKQQGSFSMYYDIDVDNIKPILLKSNK